MATINRIEPTKENLAKVASVLVEAFGTTDPIMEFMINSAPPKLRAYIREKIWFQALVTAASKNRAEFYEVGGFKGVSIWMPPGEKVDNPLTLVQSGLVKMTYYLGLKGLYRMFGCFTPAVEGALKKHLDNRPHWYCFFVAVLPSQQGKGYSRLLMAPHSPGLGTLVPSHAEEEEKLRARLRKGKKGEVDGDAQVKVPVWLEATTRKSRDIYERFGWKEVSSQQLGKGWVNEMGADAKGGPGATIWCMAIDA